MSRKSARENAFFLLLFLCQLHSLIDCHANRRIARKAHFIDSQPQYCKVNRTRLVRFPA